MRIRQYIFSEFVSMSTINDPLQRLKNIEKLLAKGELESALDQLLALAPQKLKPSVIGLSARFHRLKQENEEGVLVREQYWVEQNGILKATTNFCMSLRTYFQSENTNVLLSLANNLAKEEKYDLALEYYDKVYEADEDNTELLINRASTKIMLFAFNEAIVDLNEAYEKGSTNPYGYYLRAIAYEAMGLPEKADADRKQLDDIGIDFRHLE